MREMNADLMRTAGLQLRLEERQRRVVVGPRLAAVEDRQRGLALGLDAHAALAVAALELVERQPDGPLFVPPLAARQDQVALVGVAVA